MRIDHHRWFSHRLGRDMGVAVFGYWGPPLLTFPTSGGGEWEYQAQSLIGAIGDAIEAGRLKVYSINANGSESFYNKGAHPYHRSWMQRMYAEYVRDEVVPFIRAHFALGLAAGLLKPVSDTTTSFEDPNIVGSTVTLRTHSGGVGDAVGYQAIGLTPPLTLSEDQRIALAAAERDDLVYLGPSVSVTAEFSAAGNTITRTDGGSWEADGFKPRMRMELVDSKYNDTAGGLLYEVQSVTESKLTLTSEADLTDETGVKVTITPEAITPMVFTTVEFSAAGNTITRTDGGNWLTDIQRRHAHSGDGGHGQRK